MVAVKDQAKVPPVAYAWLGFCRVEVPPSPKLQAHEGDPVQLAGAAVAWKETGAPTDPLPDTVAVQVTEQVGGPTVICQAPLP